MADFYDPESWFAWRPVNTRDAGWVWWRYVWRQRFDTSFASWWRYTKYRQNAV